jgi:hypothetical protein
LRDQKPNVINQTVESDGQTLRRSSNHVKSLRWIPFILTSILLASIARADVTVTTPYPYDSPPAPGVEKGTYAFNGSGYAGVDCFTTIIGAVKFLPDGSGKGGTMCVKANIQFLGAGPICASAIASGEQKQLFLLSGPYTYNHDGTMCENLKILGGIFNGLPATFHDYVSPKGDLIFLANENIDYACPGIAQTQSGLAIGTANLFKISKVGDDPPGSGKLDCTNP